MMRVGANGFALSLHARQDGLGIFCTLGPKFSHSFVLTSSALELLAMATLSVPASVRGQQSFCTFACHHFGFFFNCRPDFTSKMNLPSFNSKAISY